MKQALVVYYSRTGHTRQIAEAIAAACGADLEAIRDVRSRGGLLGGLRSAREAWLERLGEIGEIEKDPGHYDLVVLGTPVWAAKVSSPVRTYITEQGSRIKRVALFCTEGGVGGEKALRQMAALCGREPIATLIVTERELKSGAFQNKVASFTQALA